MYVDYYESPIGLLKITADSSSIFSLEEERGKTVNINNNNIIDELKIQLDEYFDGKRTKFDIDIKMNGSEFQLQVWRELIKIPYGEMASYKDIATRLGKPGASIAVGNANNKNKLLLLVPCHRVIGSNGVLVGFRLGLEAKKYLLDLERK